MLEVLDNIPAELAAEPLRERVHLAADSEYAPEFVALVARARAVARPKVLYRECFIQARDADTVTIDGITFTSRTLRANLESAQRVFAYVATCGTEVNGLPIPAGDFLQQHWHEAIKGALLGAALAHLTAYLDRRYALGKTATMNPGSGDVTVWPIEQQRELFRLIGDVKGRIGVDLTDTMLMLPNKSVSGIRFSTGRDFRTCQLCRREGCPNRSAPFDPRLWAAVGPDVH